MGRQKGFFGFGSLGWDARWVRESCWGKGIECVHVMFLWVRRAWFAVGWGCTGPGPVHEGWWIDTYIVPL